MLSHCSSPMCFVTERRPRYRESTCHYHRRCSYFCFPSVHVDALPTFPSCRGAAAWRVTGRFDHLCRSSERSRCCSAAEGRSPNTRSVQGRARRCSLLSEALNALQQTQLLALKPAEMEGNQWDEASNKERESHQAELMLSWSLRQEELPARRIPDHHPPTQHAY